MSGECSGRRRGRASVELQIEMWVRARSSYVLAALGDAAAWRGGPRCWRRRWARAAAPVGGEGRRERCWRKAAATCARGEAIGGNEGRAGERTDALGDGGPTRVTKRLLAIADEGCWTKISASYVRTNSHLIVKMVQAGLRPAEGTVKKKLWLSFAEQKKNCIGCSRKYCIWSY